MTASERWLPIPGWEGMYEISDQGRVKALAREYVRADGKPDRKPERIMRIAAGKPNRYGPGYGSVMLQGEGRKVRDYVHRLVLRAFVGPPPKGTECLHENGVATDCRLENLRWGTHSDNGLDRTRHGHDPHASQTHCRHGHAFDEGNTILSRNSAGVRFRRCRICKNTQAKASYERKHPIRRLRYTDQCVNGHAYTEENTSWVLRNGVTPVKVCRTCHALRARELRARRKEQRT